RNNTIDSLLVLTLLLAAWAFIRATETGKLRHLLLGALIVGLGFNIKMLQAYLALPAFFALYLLGARVGWWRKIWQLAVAGIVVLAVSFSWALAVDLTPPSQRPYVGSSTDNTVTELIIGHNGLSRLLGRGRTSISLGNSSQQQPGGSGGDADQATRPQGPDGANDGTQMTPPQMTGGTDGSNSQASRRPQPPSGAGQRPSGSGPGGQPPDGGGGMGGNEIGQAGWLRLVSSPLSNEVSWLLPFGLLGVALLSVGSRLRLPVEPRHQALVLWGGWLGTELVFFSMASFFHAYYLTMLAAPLAALVGMAATELWRMRERRPRIAIGLLLLAATGTLAAQYAMAGSYVSDRWWAPIAVAALAIGALLLFIAQRHQLAPLARAGFGLAVAATLVTPLVWSTLTTTDPSPNARLPHAYAGSSGRGGGGQSRNGDQVDTSLISFLEANTQDVEYLVAVPSANEGDVYVLATGRPVLYMGGFSGSDSVVSADDLAQMVDSGKLRYVLWGGDQRGNSDLSNWIASHATIVAGFDQVGGRGTTLYELR
ncbi:MAG: hypothetical protein HGA65_19950, partial [Oscillochloris sp.]|nr:hypothetical protein [Oscillochloris sp.]